MRANRLCRRLCIFSLLFGLFGLIGCGSDDDAGGGPLSVQILFPDQDEFPANTSIDAHIVVSGTDAFDRRPGVRLELTTEGGGFVDAPTAVTDAAGEAIVRWTFGSVPVYNFLTASSGGAAAKVGLPVTLAAPLEPTQFGDIPGLIAAEMLPGSTEDLAFDGDRRLVLGIGGGLIEMDPQGNAATIALGGDAIEAPLGIAYDADGNLWVADSRDGPMMPEPGALLRVSPDGVVTTVLTALGDADLVGPNYVAIGVDGKVYLSDPCIGAVARIDPTSGAVDDVVHFDLATQGGPNGLAFDPDGGRRLFLATESVALLCGRPDVDPTLIDPVAGLFTIDVDETGFGEIVPVAERMGLFGDGVAFDAEGNLYVIFDTQANLALEESAIWVLPAPPSALIQTELVKFLAASDRVFANMAFGRGEFGDGTMYISLLAIDAFGLPIRGVDRIDVGIPGAFPPY